MQKALEKGFAYIGVLLLSTGLAVLSLLALEASLLYEKTLSGQRTRFFLAVADDQALSLAYRVLSDNTKQLTGWPPLCGALPCDNDALLHTPHLPWVVVQTTDVSAAYLIQRIAGPTQADPTQPVVYQITVRSGTMGRPNQRVCQAYWRVDSAAQGTESLQSERCLV